jgi:glutathione S-transferase
LSLRLDALELRLAAGEYLMGAAFSVADIYLFVVTGWFGRLQIPLAQWPHIARFRDVVAARPAVQAALQAEGLL